jgi:hypothetical protein
MSVTRRLASFPPRCCLFVIDDRRGSPGLTSALPILVSCTERGFQLPIDFIAPADNRVVPLNDLLLRPLLSGIAIHS